jgi:hypothetical protein
MGFTSAPTSFPFAVFAGEPGSDAASLMSEKLLLRPSALELCPLRWLNLIPRRGFAIVIFVMRKAVEMWFSYGFRKFLDFLKFRTPRTYAILLMLLRAQS